MPENGLPKSSRLHSRKLIGKLFEEGEASYSYPIKTVYCLGDFDDGEPLKAAFSVSKRNFKHAVDRNRFKRLMREAFRLNCHELKQTLQQQNAQLAVMFIYANKERSEYHAVEKAMKKQLLKLTQISQSHQSDE